MTSLLIHHNNLVPRVSLSLARNSRSIQSTKSHCHINVNVYSDTETRPSFYPETAPSWNRIGFEIAYVRNPKLTAPVVCLQAIPHSIDSIRVSQHLGHSFIEAARKSSHQAESEEEELEMQIYNLAPVFTARDIVMEPSYDGASPSDSVLSPHALNPVRRFCHVLRHCESFEQPSLADGVPGIRKSASEDMCGGAQVPTSRTSSTKWSCMRMAGAPASLTPHGLQALSRPSSRFR